MREIKFRGKRLDNGEWVYGDLHIRTPSPHIHSEIDYGKVNIDPHTVGQFTGLHDKNGKEIYEGDVITQYLVLPNYRNARRGQVLFDKLWCFVLLSKGRLYHLFGDGLTQEVQGNIHDNPELLKTE